MVIETDVDDSPINFLYRLDAGTNLVEFYLSLLLFFSFLLRTKKKERRKGERARIERGADTLQLYFYRYGRKRTRRRRRRKKIRRRRTDGRMDGRADGPKRRLAHPWCMFMISTQTEREESFRRPISNLSQLIKNLDPSLSFFHSRPVIIISRRLE